MIRFIEHHEPGYPARTIVNARAADLTIAFAIDFNSPGERLTHKAAYGKYVGINFGYLTPPEMQSPDGIELPFAVETALYHLKAKKATHVNFAGNGIYSLTGFDQIHVDLLCLNFLEQLIEVYPLIKTIRSGCQTGIDEAFLKAADKLGIEGIGLAPKNWLFRSKEGKDISRDESAFMARFGDQYVNDI